MDLEAFRPAVRVVDDRKQRWRTDGFEATDPLPVVSRGVPAGADAPVTSQPLGGGLRPHVAVRWPSATPANDGHPGCPERDQGSPTKGRSRHRAVRGAWDNCLPVPRGAVPSSRVSDRILNLRDLGGLKTADGRHVAHRRLYRSGSLHELTRQDGPALEALGIGIVIDLRSDWERMSQPYDLPARVVAAPLVDDESVKSIHAAFDSGTITNEALEDWWNLTRVFQAPEEHAASLTTVFKTLVDAAPGEGVLFHCRGGKDRTGLVSALVLDALGVTWDEIVSDFMRSNLPLDDEHLAAHLAPVLAALAPNGLSSEALFSLIGVRREWLEDLFGRIEGSYGSVTRYVTDTLGIGSVGLAILRDRYLEPGASRAG